MRKLLSLLSSFLAKVKGSAVKKVIPLAVLNRIKILNYLFLLYYDVLLRGENRDLSKFISSITRPKKRILFYPVIPWESSMIFHICIQGRYLITNRISKNVDLILKWNPVTFSPSDRILDELREKARIINYDCSDISKSQVAEIFRKTFGYDYEIDPLTYQGKCVKKSNNNALHDGQIIDCPIDQVQEGFVYQVLIDNEVEDGLVLDIRIPIFMNCIPFILNKYRPADGRFHADSVRLQIVETSAAISPNEQERVLAFCRLIGLDYGELDVLRDRNSGNLYIVDVNNTPHGYPVRYAPQLERLMREVIQRQARAFSDTFMDGA